MAYYTANIPPELKEHLDAAIAKKQKPASQKSEEDEEEEDDSEDKEEKVFEMFDRMVTRLEHKKPAAFLSTAPDATTESSSTLKVRALMQTTRANTACTPSSKEKRSTISW